MFLTRIGKALKSIGDLGKLIRVHDFLYKIWGKLLAKCDFAILVTEYLETRKSGGYNKYTVLLGLHALARQNFSPGLTNP